MLKCYRYTRNPEKQVNIKQRILWATHEGNKGYLRQFKMDPIRFITEQESKVLETERHLGVYSSLFEKDLIVPKVA